MQRRARETAGFSEERERKSSSESHSQKQQNVSYGVQKEQPKRVQMPDDYLQNLKEYAKSISDKNNYAENDAEKINSQEDTKNQSAFSGNTQNRNTPSAKKSTDGLKGVLGDIKIDEDKALLLSLVLLLSEENADETLILALLYMLS
jgi:hypothetical protein